MRLVSLVVLLACLWMLLSGHTEPLLLGMGGASLLLIAWLARRMGVIDDEGLPLEVTHRAAPYSAWLLMEILKANVAMLKVVTAKELVIEPQLIRVPTGTRSSLGRVIYANSITMTPGTVTVEADEDTLLVHAIDGAAAAGLRTREMERRAARVPRRVERGQGGPG